MKNFLSLKKFWRLTALTILLATAAFNGVEGADQASYLTGPPGMIQSSDLYWVTFSGDCSCDYIFVMQIDSDGNVIQPPKAVLDIARYGTGATALGKLGSGKLILWHWDDSSFLLRAQIKKNNLKPSKLKTTDLYSFENEFLQVSQNKSANFILAEDSADSSLNQYPVNKRGIPTGQKGAVSPQAPLESDEASLSADGLAVVTNRSSAASSREKLYLQLLDETGSAKGSPKFLAKYKDIEASDVSSLLDDDKRFVVFTVDEGTTPDDRVYLQVVNSSGKKSGKKILINTPPDRDEDSQTIAIDPEGRFVLFTMDGVNYGCTDQDILAYQALTPDGKPNGSLKVLADCNLVTDDIMNLDVLKE
jgi:hypothetical protein